MVCGVLNRLNDLFAVTVLEGTNLIYRPCEHHRDGHRALSAIIQFCYGHLSQFEASIHRQTEEGRCRLHNNGVCL